MTVVGERLRIGVAYALLVWLAGCLQIEPIELGRCGNAVLDPGEDCDSGPNAASGGLVCGAPESSEAACRYMCRSDGTGPACPVGWDCGIDRVCRHPSDGFVSGGFVAWNPDSMAAADLDGDGVTELVGAFTNRIETLSRGASGGLELGHSFFTRLATGPISAVDLDGDGLADVLLPNDHGVSIWRGQPTGEPLPVAFSNVPLPDAVTDVWVVPAHHDKLPEGALLAMYEAGNLFGQIVQWGESVAPTPVSFPYHLADLAGDRMPMARLSNYLGDSVAFAFRGKPQVELRRILKSPTDGHWTVGSTQSISLESVGVVEHGAMFARVDDDDALDLLIGLDNNAAAVARGTSDGAFGAPQIDPRLHSWPLAAADLDGDGLADYVTSEGVFRTSHDPPYPLKLVQAGPSLNPWTGATVADLDGNGSLDVVAFAEGTPQLDVLRCGDLCKAGGNYSLHQYPISGGVVAVRAGDLRDTPYSDLVVVSRTPDRDLINVMNGTADWPEVPRVRARFHRVERVEVGRAAFPGEAPDAFEDVWITSRSPSGRVSVGFLFSDADGVLSSALPLQQSYGSDYAKGHVALLGRFVSEAGLPWSDAVFMGRTASGDCHAWWLPGAEEARFSPGYDNARLETQLGASFNLDCSRFASGDLDGDGIDEIVVVYGAGVCGSGPILLGVGGFESKTLDVVPQQIDLAGTSAAVAVADVDGDGHGEIIVATEGAAHVFKRDATLAHEAYVVDLPADEPIIEAATLTRAHGASGPRRVAVLTEASLMLLDSKRLASHVGPARGRAVHSADMNGDGLGDVLVHTEGGVETWLATPADPLGGKVP